jgi:hypothetical protein
LGAAAKKEERSGEDEGAEESRPHGWMKTIDREDEYAQSQNRNTGN